MHSFPKLMYVHKHLDFSFENCRVIKFVVQVKQKILSIKISGFFHLTRELRRRILTVEQTMMTGYILFYLVLALTVFFSFSEMSSMLWMTPCWCSIPKKVLMISFFMAKDSKEEIWTKKSIGIKNLLSIQFMVPIQLTGIYLRVCILTIRTK